MINTNHIKEELDILFKRNDKVFIVPHVRPDYDALGSALGMALICKENNKECFIVIDENVNELDNEIRKIIKKINEEFEIIKSDDTDKYASNNLVIVVDTNKINLIPMRKKIKRFNDILVIDHHKTDAYTINTPNLYIDHSLSSVCEEVVRLLSLYKINLKSEYANYLLAGIILDTYKFSKNVSSRTFNVAASLVSSGANPTIANNMFLEDFGHDRKIQRLVDNTFFFDCIFAIACEEDEMKMYDPEDIAKASDYLLKYNITCSFSFAYIDYDTISISARSKGLIDVSKIMKIFGGGGNEYSAAAKIKGSSIVQVKEMLLDILSLGCNYNNDVSNSNTLKLEI